MTDTKVHHNTRKAADLALAKRLISRSSYEAILAGTLTLAEAKELGRGGGPDTREGRGGSGTATRDVRSISGDSSADMPPQPVSRVSKNERGQECWCGCGSWTSPGKRWRQGHDQRGKGIIKRAVKEGKMDELNARLRDYGRERGLI